MVILYDETGKSYRCINGPVDVGLAANGEADFKLNYPGLPDDIGSKFKSIEGNSYEFTW